MILVIKTSLSCDDVAAVKYNRNIIFIPIFSPSFFLVRGVGTMMSVVTNRKDVLEREQNLLSLLESRILFFRVTENTSV